MRSADRVTWFQRVSRHLLVCCLVVLLVPGSALAQRAKPRVAILVYEGVQVIDHAIPFEVFGQFALNDVYTVAKDPGPLTTYMGMRILPNYTFENAPPPDVLVLPGGNAGDAQKDPRIQAWIAQTAASARHVLTICTGIFFLAGNDLLNGKQVTTWYSRQESLRSAHPEAHVVGDRIVVEDGKLVSAAGLGVEGSLAVLSRLHGPAWAELVRLNMEHEPIPDSLHTPRVTLVDMLLPRGIYGVFPWREAEFTRFDGNQEEWHMGWRYPSAMAVDSLAATFRGSLVGEQGWSLVSERRVDSAWTSRWCIRKAGVVAGMGEVSVVSDAGLANLRLRVWKTAQACESGGP